MRAKLVRLCATCAYAVIYADTSGISEEDLEAFATFVDEADILVHVRKEKFDTPRACPACPPSSPAWSEGHVFEKL